MSSLKFAARASRVKVVAKVTRYIDYEALYFGAQKELDSRDQRERELAMSLAKASGEVEEKEREIESLKEGLRSLQAELTAASSSSGRGVVPASSSAAEPAAGTDSLMTGPLHI